MKLLATDALERRQLVAVVDSNPARRGFSVRGVSVTAPEALRCPRTPIVVATLLQHDSVVAQLRRLGLTNPVVGLTRSPAPR
jgi:hypothetical protein